MQERLLDEDGHPRKAKAGEDPQNIGLSLDYMFESFEATAESARTGAQRRLGEQVFTLSLEPSSDLLLSTSQGRALQAVSNTRLPMHTLQSPPA